MTSRDFCYWLQGFFELSPSDQHITAEQAKCIKAHLNLVFIHEIDPSMGGAKHQAELNAAHDGKVATEAHKPTPDPFPAKPPRPPYHHNPDTRIRC